jgi:aminoglycoside 3-N-acetyltransferase
MLTYQIMAAIEVSGRMIFDRIPRLRHWVTRRVRKTAAEPDAVELQEFELFLQSLGITDGDILMVQSAWDGLRGLRARPSEVIAVFKKLIGPNGTLIMPTGPLPVTRDGIQVYDVDKSPSSLGLLSESFRRMPNVKRGMFPLAPVSAYGPLADVFTRDFRMESGNTAYGKGSPYWELGQRNGKVLILGIDFIRAVTLFHSAFDVLGCDNPIREFHVDMQYIVSKGGQEERITIRHPHPKWSSYLATGVFGKLILQSGACERTVFKGIKIAIIDARRFLTWHLEIARTAGWPYWGFPKANRK